MGRTWEGGIPTPHLLPAVLVCCCDCAAGMGNRVAALRQGVRVVSRARALSARGALFRREQAIELNTFPEGLIGREGALLSQPCKHAYSCVSVAGT